MLSKEVEELKNACDRLVNLKKQINYYDEKLKENSLKNNKFKNEARLCRIKIKELSKKIDSFEFILFYNNLKFGTKPIIHFFNSQNVNLLYKFIKETIIEILNETKTNWKFKKIFTSYVGRGYEKGYTKHFIEALVLNKTKLSYSLNQKSIIKLVTNGKMILLDENWSGKRYDSAELINGTKEEIDKYIEKNHIQSVNYILGDHVFKSTFLSEIENTYSCKFENLKTELWKKIDEQFKKDRVKKVLFQNQKESESRIFVHQKLEPEYEEIM